MSIINICLYLYLLLKPFYLKSSGTIQISDVFIFIAFIFTIASSVKTEGKEKINSNQKILLLFLLCVVFINTIYYGIYSDISFLKSILYYAFLFIGIFTFSNKIQDYKFLKHYYVIFIIDLLIQIIIYIIGIGRYYGSTRYMGTFNDPNQFAFFITLAIMYIYTLENILQIKRRAWYAYATGLVLILLSSSTGMILAIVTFLAIQVICNINKVKKLITKKHNKKIIYISIIICLILITTIVFCLFICDRNYKLKEIIESRIESIVNSQIGERIIEKFNKLKEKDKFLEDRHLDKFFDNLHYILYGAGEGRWYRFGDNEGEIHSTLPSLLFCYGILPTCILALWIYLNLKGLNLKELSVYIAILIESFTLINQRQLLLWIIIILANLYKKENKFKKDEGT
ncbi:MAG: hypothetical protein ACI4VE_05045 [Clostridia bacterium]